MIVEKEIESKIMNKLQTAIPDCMIAGSWQTAALKDFDNNSLQAIKVVVSPRLYQTHQIPVCDIAVNVVVVDRYDADETGEKLVEIEDKIFEILQQWQDDIDIVVDDFSISTFDPAGFKIDGGTAPSMDETNGIWMVSHQFTIRGSVNRI